MDPIVSEIHPFEKVKIYKEMYGAESGWPYVSLFLFFDVFK